MGKDILLKSLQANPFMNGRQFSSVQLLSHVWLFATQRTAARQASLSITNSWSLPKLMSIESVIQPTISSSDIPFSSCPQSFPASGSFPMVSSLHQVDKYWSLTFNINPSSEHPGLFSFKMDWLDLLAVQGSSPTPHFKSINSSVLSFLHSPTLTSIHDHWKNHSLD